MMPLATTAKTVLMGLGLVLLNACTSDTPGAALSGGGNLPSQDDPAPVVSTTSQVLQTARTEDDAGAPVAINNGAFGFNDSSDFTDPVSINR